MTPIHSQGGLTELLRGADSNFIPDANNAFHPTHVGFRAGFLVRPFDHPLQGDQAVVHFRGHSVTRSGLFSSQLYGAF